MLSEVLHLSVSLYVCCEWYACGVCCEVSVCVCGICVGLWCGRLCVLGESVKAEKGVCD